jgi:hypothetical protein
MNKDLTKLHERFFKIKVDLKDLLDDYDGAFREINKIYVDERTFSGTTAGLEDFYRLLQVMRRNRDVIGSLVRGSSGLRPVDKFKFVEEEVPEEKVAKTVKRKAPPPSGPNIQEVEEIEKAEELV